MECKAPTAQKSHLIIFFREESCAILIYEKKILIYVDNAGIVECMNVPLTDGRFYPEIIDIIVGGN
jgi:hypothetical protein